MAVTINHQTNDISATSGSLTIDGAAAGGGGGGPVRLPIASIGGFSRIPPIDLGYYHSSGLNFNTNETLFVPWVAPIDGTVDGISLYFSANNVTTSQEVALGVYSDSAGMPDTRLSFGTFDPNGLGTSWKSITGLSQSVTQNTLYWLAASTNAVAAQIQCRCYRRNGFMPRPVTGSFNDDQSLLTSGQQVSSMTVVPYVGSTTNEPFLIVATYL